MTGREYQELLVFMAVAKDRGFRGAARRLGMTPSVVSRTIGQLERRIGTRLLNRTTRSTALTEIGRVLYDRISPLVAALDGAVADVAAAGGTAAGTIRLNLPRVAAELILRPLLSRFEAAYPRITLELGIDDAVVDIIADGFDAGVRFGERLVQDMAAVRLTADLSNAVVGSPAYFERHTVPTHPRDLLQHVCLNYKWRASEEIYRWRFEEDGRFFELAVPAGLTVDDTGILREAAIDGMGLACLPDLLVSALVKQGLLVRVLEAFCPPQAGFFLYYPLNGHPSAALSAFIGFVRAALPIPDLGPSHSDAAAQNRMPAPRS